jgi:hypothetical protein
MSYTTINKSGLHFNTKLYAGSNSTQAVTGVGFQPDWVWIKNRSSTPDHKLHDVVRGSNKNLTSNSNAAEQTYTYFNSFDSDGFTLDGNVSDYNQNGSNFVSWNWKAGGSSTTNPSSGTITTTASVNTTAGFSVFTYTGNGSAAHIAHGLGVAPTVVWIKGRSSTPQWFVKHPGLSANQYLYLDGTNAATSGANAWSATNPDATKIYIGTDGGVNGNGETYVCYAFAEKTGFSKFGSYIGNGYANGTFVYTGFKPAFVINKRIDSTGNWMLIDNKRLGYNPAQRDLRPNLSNAEGNDETFDFLSNGFKVKTTSNDFGGGSGATYIFMAFAEEPLVGTNNVPATAR